MKRFKVFKVMLVLLMLITLFVGYAPIAKASPQVTGAVCPPSNVKYNIDGGYEKDQNDETAFVEGDEDEVTITAAPGNVVVGVCIKIGGPGGGSLIFVDGAGTYGGYAYGISHVVVTTKPEEPPEEPEYNLAISDEEAECRDEIGYYLVTIENTEDPAYWKIYKDGNVVYEGFLDTGDTDSLEVTAGELIIKGFVNGEKIYYDKYVVVETQDCTPPEEPEYDLLLEDEEVGCRRDVGIYRVAIINVEDPAHWRIYNESGDEVFDMEMGTGARSNMIVPAGDYRIVRVEGDNEIPLKTYTVVETLDCTPPEEPEYDLVIGDEEAECRDEVGYYKVSIGNIGDPAYWKIYQNGNVVYEGFLDTGDTDSFDTVAGILTIRGFVDGDKVYENTYTVEETLDCTPPEEPEYSYTIEDVDYCGNNEEVLYDITLHNTGDPAEWRLVSAASSPTIYLEFGSGGTQTTSYSGAWNLHKWNPAKQEWEEYQPIAWVTNSSLDCSKPEDPEYDLRIVDKEIECREDVGWYMVTVKNVKDPADWKIVQNGEILFEGHLEKGDETKFEAVAGEITIYRIVDKEDLFFDEYTVEETLDCGGKDEEEGVTKIIETEIPCPGCKADKDYGELPLGEVPLVNPTRIESCKLITVIRPSGSVTCKKATRADTYMVLAPVEWDFYNESWMITRDPVDPDIVMDVENIGLIAVYTFDSESFYWDENQNGHPDPWERADRHRAEWYIENCCGRNWVSVENDEEGVYKLWTYCSEDLPLPENWTEEQVTAYKALYTVAEFGEFVPFTTVLTTGN